MKVELTTEQRDALLKILAQANIRGADAPLIVSLAKSLQEPLFEEKKSE